MKEMSNKKMTGYASIDNPQSIGSTFFEKNPIIPCINIYTLIKLLSRGKLDDPAVDCLDLKANYKKLLDDAVTISLALKELGVKKGDIVSVAMPNLYQGLATYFACNRIGAVTSYLDAVASPEEVNSYLNLFESPILINFDKSDEYNKKIKDSTKVKHIITLNKNNINSLDLTSNYKITSNDNLIDFNSLESISKYQKHKFEPLHSKKEDSLILFTSGSTGKPKAVVLTNENILAAEIYAMNTSHTENITGNKTMTCVPFSYPYGFVTSALTSLLWGKETILAPNMSKDTIAYYFAKNPNIVFGSPALLDLTMNYIPKDQDLSSVSHFISGGDFLTLSHAKRANEFFAAHGAKDVEVGNGFGNAETVSIGATPVGVPLRQETAGKILVGTNVMIVDPDTMEEKKYGEEGLLCVSGKHVFKGYFNNPELTAETKFKKNGKEYYITGAMGKIDKQGYFTITGRQSRFYIMSSLNKVYLDNVQGIISTYDCVKDCAVVKVPDQEQLYVNKAYIVLNKNFPNSEEMKELINQKFYLPTTSSSGEKVQLKPYEIPTYIEFIEEMPRISGSEKIDYKALEEDAIKKLNSQTKLKVKTHK
ncbi:MAG: acyl--CoA ligase [Bacilli bacterium]|nr:acyl--CoA ligase [Bacilli bacterium]